MKKLVFILIAFLFIISCKEVFKAGNQGNFAIANYSDKIIEFIWIVPEGEFYPTAKNIAIGYGQSYEFNGIPAGIYDIAIDFKNEYNSFNSKKDKNLCLSIEKGLKKTWVVSPSGEVIRN